MSDTNVVVGIDIGGTAVRGVALSSDGEVRDRFIVPTSVVTGPTQVIGALASWVRDLVGGGRLTSVGIGASGPVDPDGTISNPDTLPTFSWVPIPPLLGKELGVPVVVENDALCAAVAEYEVGAGQGERGMLHVTLGTGIGAALIVDGQPRTGADGLHPEAGHISTAGGPAPCYCGRNACWEQRASRQAAQRDFANALGVAPDDPHVLERAAELARGGDVTTLRIFERYAEALADGLGTLSAVLRPTAIVLGGSMVKQFDIFGPLALARLQHLEAWIAVPRLLATTLDDDGGAIGAAILGSRR